MFPDSWKEARIAPLFKSSKTDDRLNCRPISVLPVASRLSENSNMINLTCTSNLTKNCTQISMVFAI